MEAEHAETHKEPSLTRHAKVFAVYLAITITVFWPIVAGITNTVVNGGGDAYQSMWNLWWVGYSLFSLHASPYFTSMIYFPVGASLVTQTLTPIAGILSIPFQLISLPFAYNIIFLLSFAAAGLFMYMLARHITGDGNAAFIAGIVFTFSSMHIAQSYGHLDWTIIGFLPLFVLSFLMMRKEEGMAYPLLAAVSFLLMTFMGDIEQGIIGVLLTIMMLVFYIARKQDRGSVLNAGFAKRFSAMVLLIAVLGSPFFIPIIQGTIQFHSLSTANQLSSISNNEIWSQGILSYFLPSPFNPFFSGISRYYSSVFGPDPTEKVAYVGYLALALAIFGVYKSYKHERVGSISIWVFLLLVFGWLSLGPFIQLGGTPTQIPGIYYLYRYVPLFNILREPGRFDIIVTICMAVLAAIGFKELVHGRMAQRMTGPDGRRRLQMITAAAVLVMLIEYSGVPLPGGQFISNMYMNASIPKAYSELGNVPGNFTVLILPDEVNLTRPALYTGMSEYYQTAFRKEMVGGYTSRVNSTQQLSVDVLPISIATSYLEHGYGFVYPSVVATNFTALNLLVLEEYHVRFISVMRGAFNKSELDLLYSYLYSNFGRPIYQGNTTIVFSTTTALLNAGDVPLAYSTDNWIPGYALCPYGSACNSTLSGMWWGADPRSVVVYVPGQYSNLTLNFTAISPGQPPNSTSLFLFSSNSTVPIGHVQLSGSPGSYSLPIQLPQGFNNLYFYIPNSTSAAGSILGFGVRNISIGYR
jgi:uncharacterized membrane protein YvlD (DUF360 family)